MNFKALGNKGSEYHGLETFSTPPDVVSVTLVSKEVTSTCPVTGQPDFYKVTAEFVPRSKCVESKTWKLFLQSFREKGLFCEEFAQQILRELVAYLSPSYAIVTITQVPRGGVKIKAVAEYRKP